MTRVWLGSAALVVAVAVALASLSGAQPPSAAVPLGFTSDSFRAERQAETRLIERLSAERVSNVHRALTARPHRSGTAGAEAVAHYLRDTLAGAGLEVELTEYLAYLSEPQSVHVEMTAPARQVLATKEPSDPRDPTSAHPELDPGFIAYSPSGDVTAAVVDVGYGLPADYARLKASGIDVAGKIALARYGRSHRAVKVYTAERAGAAAVLLYSHPADDGAGRGATWPDGMWRAPSFIQRGNAKYSWFWHGDPLTPGVAASAAAPALDPATAPTLPRIPVAVVAAAEAEAILSRLPAPVTVRLHVVMDNGRKPIRNVVATLRGREQPDRWVILGTHHDAWTFGGIDPGSSAAVIVEVATQLAALTRSGWRPARSIVFAFWDAEEYGLVGSTEFAEDRARQLQEQAVVYINSDMYSRGRLVAGGVPSLRDFVGDLVRGEPAPGAKADPAASPAELSPLGSGADFVAFQDHLGIPTLALEYLFEGGYGFGAYHSSYDSRDYMERVVDPGFTQGMTLAGLLGRAVMRLASAPVLPFRPSHYLARVRGFLHEAEGWPATLGRPAQTITTGPLQVLASDTAKRARELERWLDAELSAGRVPANAAAINDGLVRLERMWLDTSQPADVNWYRHVIYGWNIYSMYDGQPLPGLYEAIRVGDAAAIAREQQRLREALLRMQSAVEALARLAGVR